MVDHFAMGLTHLLLALAAWRLVLRADLDRDPEGGRPDAPSAPDRAEADLTGAGRP